MEMTTYAFPRASPPVMGGRNPARHRRSAPALEPLQPEPQRLRGGVQVRPARQVREPLPLPVQDAVRRRTPFEIVIVHDENAEILVWRPREFVEQGVVIAAEQHAVPD